MLPGQPSRMTCRRLIKTRSWADSCLIRVETEKLARSQCNLQAQEISLHLKQSFPEICTAERIRDEYEGIFLAADMEIVALKPQEHPLRSCRSIAKDLLNDFV